MSIKVLISGEGNKGKSRTFQEIVKEMDENGLSIQVPEGYVTGDEFERWLREQTADKEKNK